MIHTCRSGSYGLILTLCGPLLPCVSANRRSYCVHDSINFPLPSNIRMKFRGSYGGLAARWPVDPHEPLKPTGSFSGSLISPRFITKMRLGDSANTPEI